MYRVLGMKLIISSWIKPPGNLLVKAGIWKVLDAMTCLYLYTSVLNSSIIVFGDGWLCFYRVLLGALKVYLLSFLGIYYHSWTLSARCECHSLYSCNKKKKSPDLYSYPLREQKHCHFYTYRKCHLWELSFFTGWFCARNAGSKPLSWALSPMQCPQCNVLYFHEGIPELFCTWL